jgi:hypothetical protein
VNAESHQNYQNGVVSNQMMLLELGRWRECLGGTVNLLMCETADTRLSIPSKIGTAT